MVSSRGEGSQLALFTPQVLGRPNALWIGTASLAVVWNSQTFQVLVTKIQGWRLACRTNSIFCCACSRALQWTEMTEVACTETQPS